MKIERRSGVAGIIAAVLMFAMLFTIGASYFIYVSNANSLLDKTFLSRSNQLFAASTENMIVTTAITTDNTILTYFNDTGTTNINATALYLIKQSDGSMLKCFGVGQPAGQSCSVSGFPIFVNAGKGSPAVDTLFTPAIGVTYTIKISTSNGNVFSGSYPNVAVPLAQLAVTTVGAGFLSLDFNKFYAYNTTGSGSGCNPASTGCVLTPFPGSTLGYTLSSATKTGRFYLFSITITNVDPQKRTLVLDSNSELIQFKAPTAGSGGGTTSAWSWAIGSVSGSGTTQAFSAITITYGQVVTVYFTVTPNSTGAFNPNKYPSSGDFVGILIYLHGTSGGNPYGQNIPFVTTLYR